jgi:N-acetylmuramoyl-L-alanine amidase
MRLVSDEALAALTIWQEAQGEPYQGKVAVGEVIRNRMARLYSSDGTVAGTVAKPWQFSSWNLDSVDRTRLILSLRLDDSDAGVNACLGAWRDAVAGSTFANGAVLYANLSVSSPSWVPNATQAAKIGNHTFFTDP